VKSSFKKRKEQTLNGWEGGLEYNYNCGVIKLTFASLDQVRYIFVISIFFKHFIITFLETGIWKFFPLFFRLF
jgi:hypothetical protein